MKDTVGKYSNLMYVDLIARFPLNKICQENGSAIQSQRQIEAFVTVGYQSGFSFFFWIRDKESGGN